MRTDLIHGGHAGFGAAALDPICRLIWRPRPELNRGTRFCRPLRNHSATWPYVVITSGLFGLHRNIQRVFAIQSASHVIFGYWRPSLQVGMRHRGGLRHRSLLSHQRDWRDRVIATDEWPDRPDITFACTWGTCLANFIGRDRPLPPSKSRGRAIYQVRVGRRSAS